MHCNLITTCCIETEHPIVNDHDQQQTSCIHGIKGCVKRIYGRVHDIEDEVDKP